VVVWSGGRGLRFFVKIGVVGVETGKDINEGNHLFGHMKKPQKFHQQAGELGCGEKK